MKLAIYQADARRMSVQQRLVALEATLRKNSDQQTDLLLCPELFACGYGNPEDIYIAAKALSKDFSVKLAELALRYDLAICCGYPEHIESQSGFEIYNAALCVSAQGKVLANHRKRVLPTEYEHNLFALGKQATIFDFDANWRIGLLICYEIEFPEAIRACALSGAQLILVPTALGVQWSIISHCVIPARAVENGVYLAYANYAGKDELAEYLGESVIVSPFGKDVVRAGGKETLIHANLKLENIHKARIRLPYLEDFHLLV